MNTGYFCIVVVEAICLYIFLDAIIHAIIEHRDKKEEEAATSSSVNPVMPKTMDDLKHNPLKPVQRCDKES